MSNACCSVILNQVNAGIAHEATKVARRNHQERFNFNEVITDFRGGFFAGSNICCPRIDTNQIRFATDGALM